MPKLNVKLYHLYFFAYNLLIFYILNKGGALKYILCLALAGITFGIMNNKRVYFSKIMFILPWLFYITLGEFLCIKNDTLNQYSLKQPFFYLIPFFLSLILSTYFDKYLSDFVYIQFFAIAGITLINGVQNFSSTDLMESQYAFIFGFYVIYFIYVKKYGSFLAATVMLLLTHKRIALISTIALLFFILFFTLLKTKRKYKLAINMYILLGLLMIFYVYSIKSGILNKIVSLIGVNTMGRTNIYGQISDLYSVSISFAGLGIGTVEVFIKELGIASYGLLHNDILSIYIEIGFLGFVLYWIIYYIIFNKICKKISYNKIILFISLFIYTFLIFTTDNISIYINYFYSFYMLIFSIIKSENDMVNFSLSRSCMLNSKV